MSAPHHADSSTPRPGRGDGGGGRPVLLRGAPGLLVPRSVDRRSDFRGPLRSGLVFTLRDRGSQPCGVAPGAQIRLSSEKPISGGQATSRCSCVRPTPPGGPSLVSSVRAEKAYSAFGRRAWTPYPRGLRGRGAPGGERVLLEGCPIRRRSGVGRRC